MPHFVVLFWIVIGYAVGVRSVRKPWQNYQVVHSPNQLQSELQSVHIPTTRKSGQIRAVPRIGMVLLTKTCQLFSGCGSGAREVPCFLCSVVSRSAYEEIDFQSERRYKTMLRSSKTKCAIPEKRESFTKCHWPWARYQISIGGYPHHKPAYEQFSTVIKHYR